MGKKGGKSKGKASKSSKTAPKKSGQSDTLIRLNGYSDKVTKLPGAVPPIPVPSDPSAFEDAGIPKELVLMINFESMVESGITADYIGKITGKMVEGLPDVTVHDESYMPKLKSNSDDHYLEYEVAKRDLYENIIRRDLHELTHLSFLNEESEPFSCPTDIQDEHLVKCKLDPEEHRKFLESVDPDGKYDQMMRKNVMATNSIGDHHGMRGVGVMHKGLSEQSEYDLTIATSLGYWQLIGEVVATLVVREATENGAVIRISTVHRQLRDAMFECAQQHLVKVIRDRRLHGAKEFHVRTAMHYTVKGNDVKGFKIIKDKKVLIIRLVWGNPYQLFAYSDKSAREIAQQQYDILKRGGMDAQRMFAEDLIHAQAVEFEDKEMREDFLRYMYKRLDEYEADEKKRKGKRKADKN